MPRYNQIGGGQFLDVLLSPATVATAHDTEGRQGFKGERHAVFIDGKDKGTRAQYLGPRTQYEKRVARGDQGVNDVDKVAKAHDKSYNSIGKALKAGDINKEEFTEQIKMADDVFLRNIVRTKDAPLTASIARKAIQLKSLAEEFGLLNSAVFSGGACCKEIFPPDFLLRKESSKQVGGIGPLAIALLGALAPTAIEGVVALGKKLFGGAISKSKEPIHKASVLLDRLPETKQIELLHTIIKEMGDDAFA